MEKYQDIYETMLGLRTRDPSRPDVENAFASGSLCAEEYSCMREAYERVCQRLGVDSEDWDLEQMVNSMESIQRDLCWRMFAMGFRMGQKN